MSDSTGVGSEPKLIRSRMRHTRLLALGLGFLMIFSGQQSTAQIAYDVFVFVGYFMVLSAVMGRIWCTVYIGGKKKYELVQLGPYSMMRNPLYVFSFLGVIGIGLMSEHVILTLALAAIFVIYYHKIVAREESLLEWSFPDSFGDYRSRVPRWIPNIKLYQSPERIETNPMLILIAMRDNALLFAAYPIFETIEFLQRADVVPVLLVLP